MPWQEVSTVSLRKEFVTLALTEQANRRELCRRFGISPPTAYKWLHRAQGAPAAALEDRSRRPQTSPRRTPPRLEQLVLDVRAQHTAWGGRKIRAWLLQRGHAEAPSASTITAILQRHGQIDPQESRKHQPLQRFERAAPNELWQMDFKGHFAIAAGRCHPLTVLDDHSRFALGLRACPDERGATVQQQLTAIFRRYGLPAWMLMDNGAAWGPTTDYPYTRLTVWLRRLGIGVSHCRPRHPQTQGKEERFHRTLHEELLQGRRFTDWQACQAAFDPWREMYNHERPHEALGLVPPSTRYRPSLRSFPETLPPLDYASGDAVRKGDINGQIWFHGRRYDIGKAFAYLPLGVRPTGTDGLWEVYFMSDHVASIDERDPSGNV